jgi:hypothetical protein
MNGDFTGIFDASEIGVDRAHGKEHIINRQSILGRVTL